MKLLIHDLKAEEWREMVTESEDWKVLSADEKIKPCIGCFGCWNRTPGICVQKDGYDDIGQLIHQAAEVTVISKYTYGGFSGAVKNIFDRSLGYVLPHFEIVNGESHHKKRYDEDKPFTYIFYGHDLSDENKKNAERYVKAVCTNMRTHVKEVVFLDTEDLPAEGTFKKADTDKVLLLNASMRSQNGNSALLASELAKRLHRETETVCLSGYLNDTDTLIDIIDRSSTVVFCAPLYVDGLPSQLIRLLETYEKRGQVASKKIYTLANMGLYESGQLRNLFTAVKEWCAVMGFEYGGSLGIAAGELVGGLVELMPFAKGFTSKPARDMEAFAHAIDNGEKTDDIYSGPVGFPRWLYVAIANSGWARMAKKNGIAASELFRRLP